MVRVHFCPRFARFYPLRFAAFHWRLLIAASARNAEHLRRNVFISSVRLKFSLRPIACVILVVAHTG